jgi:predicted Zn-dependent protease with MMP-like domain
MTLDEFAALVEKEIALLPARLLEKMDQEGIVIDVDYAALDVEKGSREPGTIVVGVYRRLDKTIRLFLNAFEPLDSRQVSPKIRAVLLHEIAHALGHNEDSLRAHFPELASPL